MRTVVAICAIAASAFIGPSAWAALHTPEEHVLDQYTGFPGNEAVPNYGYGVGGLTMMAQTFTVNLPGLLCHIEVGNTTDGVSWSPVSPPVVQIRNTVAGTQGVQPGSTVLGSVTLSDPVPLPGWTLPIDFMADNIQVDVGEMYAIVLWASDLTNTVSVGATGYTYDSYEAGALWATNEAGTWGLLSDVDPLKEVPVFDMQFQTYVVPVPLPAGVWLGICAVGVAGWHLKRLMA